MLWGKTKHLYKDPVQILVLQEAGEALQNEFHANLGARTRSENILDLMKAGFDKRCP